jgi:hypothetical protein
MATMAARPLMAWSLLLPLLLSGAGCRQAPPTPSRGGELITEEVAPPPDHLVDPSTDERERRAAQRTGGVLPGDFPRDFPLPEGGTLTDLGGDDGERAWLEITVPRPLAEVRRGHAAQLRATGWEGSPGQGPLRKGGREVEVDSSAAGPSTVLRIRY